MQTSAMKACFQIAECSLSYAKIRTFFSRAYTWFSEDITDILFLSDNRNNSFSIHALLYLRSFAILAWCLACLCLEKADEMLRIFKAEALADLRYAKGFISKQLAGSRKQSVVDHTLGGSACLGLDQFSEIFT